MAQLIKAIIDTQKNTYRSIGQVNAADDLELELVIQMNGQPIQFVNPQAELLIKKTDGNRVRQTKDILYQDGKFKIKVDEQGVTYPGIVTNQLVTNDEGRVSTCLFYFNVGTSLDREVLQSISKVEVLEQLDEYVVQAFANLEEYEKRILSADETIRKLNNDMNEAEKIRDAAEQKREEFKLLLESKLENGEFIGATGKQGPQGIQGERGPQGEQGPKGETGPQGPIGEQGPQGLPGKDGKNGLDGTNGQDGVTPNIQVGTVTTLEAGEQATVVNSGTKENPIFDFAIPRGENGTDGITPDMTEFEKKINEQYDKIESKNNTFKEEMNTDFGNAKTDYFGEEHLNIVDRLNSDFDNVHQRINDSSYLAYEGTNIKADNSYYGLTKELSVKGRTLQNVLLEKTNVSFDFATNKQADTWGFVSYAPSQSLFKPNTIYTFIVNVTKNTTPTPVNSQLIWFGNVSSQDSNFLFPSGDSNKGIYRGSFDVGVTVFTLKTKESFTGEEIQSFATQFYKTVNEGIVEYTLMVLEGDYTNTPLDELPFGEGIYSVGESEDNLIKIKSCGKNLFKLRNISFYKSPGITYTVDDNLTFTVNSDSTSGIYPSINTKLPAKLFKGKTVTLSCNLINYASSTPVAVQIRYIDETGFTRYVNFAPKPVLHTFTSEILSTVDFFICPNNSTNTGVVNSITVGNIMCEENTVKTEYEPYQESTQELQLTEPLRSLPNGVCDEILEDGTEIRRVGKIVLNGSEGWDRTAINENTLKFDINSTMINNMKAKKLAKCLCSNIPVVNNSNNDDFHCRFSGSSPYGTFTIWIDKNKLVNNTTSSFLEWLQINPVTVYYELAEPIIKKHNKNINLKTFEGTTHITNDNYLQPTLSCKVPTNVQATITSLILENESLNNTISVMSLENEENNLTNIETNLNQEVRLTMLELGVI